MKACWGGKRAAKGSCRRGGVGGRGVVREAIEGCGRAGSLQVGETLTAVVKRAVVLAGAVFAH